jgi:hypothetical protein
MGLFLSDLPTTEQGAITCSLRWLRNLRSTSHLSSGHRNQTTKRFRSRSGPRRAIYEPTTTYIHTRSSLIPKHFFISLIVPLHSYISCWGALERRQCLSPEALELGPGTWEVGGMRLCSPRWSETAFLRHLEWTRATLAEHPSAAG